MSKGEGMVGQVAERICPTLETPGLRGLTFSGERGGGRLLEEESRRPKEATDDQMESPGTAKTCVL
jgi:hypothetical protein